MIKTKTISDIEKRFREIIKAPEILEEMKGQCCIVCGQPYDKSKQVEDLWDCLIQAIKNYEEAVRVKEIEYLSNWNECIHKREEKIQQFWQEEKEK